MKKSSILIIIIIIVIAIGVAFVASSSLNDENTNVTISKDTITSKNTQDVKKHNHKNQLIKLQNLQ